MHDRGYAIHPAMKNTFQILHGFKRKHSPAPNASILEVQNGAP